MPTTKFVDYYNFDAEGAFGADSGLNHGGRSLTFRAPLGVDAGAELITLCGIGWARNITLHVVGQVRCEMSISGCNGIGEAVWIGSGQWRKCSQTNYPTVTSSSLDNGCYYLAQGDGPFYPNLRFFDDGAGGAQLYIHLSA